MGSPNGPKGVGQYPSLMEGFHAEMEGFHADSPKIVLCPLISLAAMVVAGAPGGGPAIARRCIGRWPELSGDDRGPYAPTLRGARTRSDLLSSPARGTSMTRRVSAFEVGSTIRVSTSARNASSPITSNPKRAHEWLQARRFPRWTWEICPCAMTAETPEL